MAEIGQYVKVKIVDKGIRKGQQAYVFGPEDDRHWLPVRTVEEIVPACEVTDRLVAAALAWKATLYSTDKLQHRPNRNALASAVDAYNARVADATPAAAPEPVYPVGALFAALEGLPNLSDLVAAAKEELGYW